MKRLFRILLTLVLMVAIAIIALRILFPLPDITNRSASTYIPISEGTTLGARVLAQSAAHPNKTGVFPLQKGVDALTSRLTLANAAETSIDAQYYIWHDDTSGIMLLNALYRAAQRGVRVRLLLDDNGIPGLDAMLAALNQHENFEVRLFNPSTIRSPKLFGYAFDFFRMNRRMHNKSFIVDGAVAIVGGRNIGDEYFALGDGAFYIDLDVLAAGAIVPETAKVFDQYWNSQSVFSIETIVEGVGDMAAYTARVDEVRTNEDMLSFMDEARNIAAEYARDETHLEWTNVQLVADDPIKGLGEATQDQLLITRLIEMIGTIESQLDLVSAYFIPGEDGTDWFTGMADSGIQVRVLTNAINTTDVLIVHSGYAKYRRALLRAGVQLFELKLRGDPVNSGLQTMPFGLSGASLHAKTFAIDDNRVFIGSFNFDPRSATLNTEMGFLIDSPTMAQDVTARFDGPVRTISYQPMLTPKSKMIWLEPLEDGEVNIYQEEPGATWMQQVALAVIGFFPVEWLL